MMIVLGHPLVLAVLVLGGEFHGTPHTSVQDHLLLGVVVLTTSDMDHPRAGGAVVVPVEAAAPAAPLAAAGAPAKKSWTRVSKRVTTWAGAAAARAPPPAWTHLSARLALAAALFGYAAAALALAAMFLAPAVKKACVPTDAEVANLRTASVDLLRAAMAQMLVATMGLLVPACMSPVTVFGPLLLGVSTALHASQVLEMLVTSCHGGAAPLR